MPVPHTSGQFGDLLDPRFQKIFHEQYRQLPDMLGELFTMPPDNGRDTMRWSSVGSTVWAASRVSVALDASRTVSTVRQAVRTGGSFLDRGRPRSSSIPASSRGRFL